MGQLVKSFDGSAIQSDQYIQFNWDGTSNDGKNLAAGMYLFSIRSELGQASWRLVKL
jgi:flagellar hook assembly protein FlgD